MSKLTLPNALAKSKDILVSPCNSPIKISKQHKILTTLRNNPLIISPTKSRKMLSPKKSKNINSKVILNPLIEPNSPDSEKPNKMNFQKKIHTPSPVKRLRKKFLINKYNRTLEGLINCAEKSKDILFSMKCGELTYNLTNSINDGIKYDYNDKIFIPDITFDNVITNNDNVDNNNKCCINCKTNSQYSSIQMSVINHHVECLKKLIIEDKRELLHGDKIHNRSAVHLACWLGYSDCLSILLNYGASVTTVDNNNQTPLHLAIANKKYECAKEILKYMGEWIDVGDKDGNTALHLAVDLSSTECVSLLLESNAKVNISNRSGLTPLHIVKDIESIKLLIKYNGDICHIDSLKRTPLHICCINHKEEILSYLLKLSTVQKILNYQDIEGNTALHYACRENLSVCAELLLKANASHLLVNQNKETPMDIAVTLYHNKCIDIISRYVNKGQTELQNLENEDNGWTEHKDEESGCNYYYNEITGESTWYKPSNFNKIKENNE